MESEKGAICPRWPELCPGRLLAMTRNHPPSAPIEVPKGFLDGGWGIVCR